MAERVEYPQTLSGDEGTQLKQIWSYLYQLAEGINNNLDAIGGNELTDDERMIMKEIIGTAEAEEASSGYESLKSLIIKTADFVQTTLTEYRLKLIGETVASGVFGRYVRQTGLDVAVTPEGITQNYSFQEIVQGLQEYKINAKNYIKTGLLRTVNSIPVYGVAIGKDVVTFEQDGTEVYNDGNKVAELTADELSFWQSGAKIASYTGSKITFYYGANEVFYIQGGKIYCAGDLELTSGNKIIIKSGGSLTIDSGNFAIDSSGNVTIKGGGQFSGELIAASGTFAGTMSAACITSGTLNAERIGAHSLGMAKLDGSLSKTDVSGGTAWVIDFTNGTFTIGSINADHITAGHMSADRIEGGTLVLGGNNNGNGSMQVNDANGNQIASLNNTGFNLNLTNFKIDSANNKFVTGEWTLDQTGIALMRRVNASRTDEFKIIKETTSIAGMSPVAKIYGKDGSTNATAAIYFEIGTLGMNMLPESDGLGSIGKSSFYWSKAYIESIHTYSLDQSSSREVKEDIRDMQEEGDRIDRLRPVTFRYKKGDGGRIRQGLIYEEAIDVMPEICTESEDQKGINYVELVPVLLKEIQGLRARVASLEERIDRLESREG